MLGVQPSDLNSLLWQSTFQLLLKLSSKSYSFLQLRVWNTGINFSLSYRCLRILFHLYCSKNLNPCWGNNKTVPVDETKTYRRDGGTAPHILIHNIGMAGEGSTSITGRLPPGRNIIINWTECWMGSKAGLGYLEKRHISGRGRDSNSVSSNPYACRCFNWAIRATFLSWVNKYFLDTWQHVQSVTDQQYS